MMALATLRERWASFAGGFAVLLLGMTMVSMSALALASAGARVPDRLAGAPVFVTVPMAERGDGNFAPDRPWPPRTVASLRERLAAIPGVAHAVADRTFYAQPVVAGRPVAQERGYAWSAARLAPYRLTAGAAPGDGEVALDRSLGLAPGTPVPVLTVHGPVTYIVSGTVDGPGVYLGDAEAERLSAGVRAIGLVTGPGADTGAVAAAARTVAGTAGVVRTGQERAVLEPRDHERTRWIGAQVLTGMTALSAFTSVLVVGSAFAVGVAQRRREFGLLRAVGATPRQVRRMVYGEALAVGVTATAAGVAAGALLGPVLGDVLVTAGFEPPGFTVRLSPAPLAASFAAGVLVTLAGVGTASRRAARVRPLEALREAEVDDRPLPRVRWVTGAACCALGLVAAAGAARSGGSDPFVMPGLVAAMGVMAGLALLSPAVVPPVTRLVTWPLTRGRGATGMLVRQNALTAVRRTAATATPVLLTVGCAVLITGLVQTTAAGFALARATAVRAGAVIVPDGTPGLTDAAASAAGARSSLFTALYDAGGTPLSAIGATPELLERAGDTRVVSGSLDALRRADQILVAGWLAAGRGLRPGSVLPVTFEDGTSASLTVGGVLGGADADVLLSRDLLRRHDPVVLAAQAYVTGTPAPPGPGARVTGVAAYAAEADAEEDRLVWIATLLLVAVSTVYAGVAIVNTMVMSAAGRARDLTVLRLSGASGRQVLTTVAAESALVVTLGTALGVLVALPALHGVRRAFATAMRADVPLVIPWPLIGTLAAACLFLAACAAVLAARPATRHAAGR
ncbi:ABC transporter permease [Sphaerisporangium rubeum]|uniref:Putative ABC transport system permease protein n=1 Tax=Sphaerisporangium rubeum TaxID=321317 RepID=A0A7X0IF40_9ACTN|nr:ABC transporter permease [Sphaerisporangium rubeum]MBB6473875.1 putative ABC transport system permease protein [Sphaerisporangium rubeum]